MKIVHVCLCGNFSETYAYQDNLLPKYHRRAGHDVTIIASAYSIQKATGGHVVEKSGVKILDDGIKLKRLKPLLPQRINIRLRLFRGLYQSICDESPDLLFVHGIESLSYPAITKYHKTHPHTDVVVDNHADWYNGYHNRLSLWLLKGFFNPLITKAFRKFVRVFYGVTPARCDFLEEAYNIPREKIKLLPFGADDDYLQLEKKEELRKEVRNRFNVSDNDFLIVTGGKLDRRKNIHLLAEAVTKINIPNLKLLIFGEPSEEMKEYYEKIRSNKVLIAGWVPSTDVYRYFYASDLVFFPGLHSVLWEQAMACQKPSVFHRIKGFEHVNFNNNSLMLDEITEETCKKALIMLFNDKEKYQAFKNNAESPKALQFTYSRIANQVIEDVENSKK